MVYVVGIQRWISSIQAANPPNLMNTEEHASLLLQKIAAEFDIDEQTRATVVFDENHECILTLEERFVVAIYLDDEVNALYLNLPIAKLPEGDSREEVMLDLLQANYSWNLTGGGTLGVDAHSGLIVLSYLVPLPLEAPDQITSILSKLLGVVDYWKKDLEEVEEEASSQGTEDLLNEGLIRA